MPKRLQAFGPYEEQFNNIIETALDKTLYFDVTAPGTANTEFSIEHGFNSIPFGFDVISKDRAADVYLSTTVATTSMLYLKCTVASAVLKIRVY